MKVGGGGGGGGRQTRGQNENSRQRVETILFVCRVSSRPRFIGLAGFAAPPPAPPPPPSSPTRFHTVDGSIIPKIRGTARRYTDNEDPPPVARQPAEISPPPATPSFKSGSASNPAGKRD
ncbi:hypothetical protein K0M31_006927 [Melipona bicolor]|uniref:Uncharacterized protein n=1 Tax=Melipona bicolor TaxID=60889 RepID=A0AA40KKL3_9HYME|nr:hypothetical protein K0M31_006927 [Melipona bicolor]